MRILSQDGKFDFPYERVCLEVSDSGKIFAQGDIWGAEDNYIEVAKYENEEKARKAMEMLCEAYMVHFQHKTMTAEQRAFFINCTDEKEHEKIYGVFRFPSDDEVEA